MGVDQSQLLLSHLMTDAKSIFLNYKNLDESQRKEFLRISREISQEDDEKKKNKALSPPLQCLYNIMYYRSPPQYTYITGLMSYIVLYNKRYNRWVWLLGERHSRYGMCKNNTKLNTIHIMKLLQDHYTTSPYFLDVFYEQPPLDEILEEEARQNELTLNSQNNNEERETITAGKIKQQKPSFVMQERYRRRNCLFHHHSDAKEKYHNTTCPSNIRFHWVDTRGIYGAFPYREDYERWKRLVSTLLSTEQKNLPISEKLVSYLFETIRTSKHFRKLKKTLKKREDEIIYIIREGVYSESEGNIEESVRNLERFTSLDFDTLSNEDKREGSHIFASLTAMLQDIYAVARMHKEYITDGTEPEFTRNCVFYGGDHHVQTMVLMLRAMDYDELEWSVSRGAVDDMCVLVRDLHQPLLHRF